MLDVVFADTLAKAAAWEQQARERRAISRTDPVADTLDHCAETLRALLKQMEEGIEGEMEVRVFHRNANRLYAELQEDIEKERDEAERCPVVYFIRNRESGLIKIGRTVNLEARLKALRLQGGLDLKLLGTLDGGREVELDMHRKFADLRVRGEWFTPDPRLVKYIAAWADAPEVAV